MWRCPVCEKEQTQGLVCDDCGFDFSCDYERNRTLCPALPKGVEPISVRVEKWKRQQKQTIKETQRTLVCPKCGGTNFSFLLDELQFLCADCGTKIPIAVPADRPVPEDGPAVETETADTPDDTPIIDPAPTDTGAASADGAPTGNSAAGTYNITFEQDRHRTYFNGLDEKARLRLGRISMGRLNVHKGISGFLFFMTAMFLYAGIFSGTWQVTIWAAILLAFEFWWLKKTLKDISMKMEIDRPAAETFDCVSAASSQLKSSTVKKKKMIITLVLFSFGWFFGVHCFYEGSIFAGVLYIGLFLGGAFLQGIAPFLSDALGITLVILYFGNLIFILRRPPEYDPKELKR